jgi:SAM-dependent methyltransferase
MGEPRPIDADYERFYAARKSVRVYPTEFVVRIMLASYPGLVFEKPAPGAKVLDVAFGDGRNTAFLAECGLAVSGIEIAQGIVDQTAERMRQLGHKVDLRVGRNTSIPFPNATFDGIVACACCYYIDEGESFADNLAEYSRVLKPGGFLIASVADRDSYLFAGASEQFDGSCIVRKDPYGVRLGYRLQAFASAEDLLGSFSKYFESFSIGWSRSDFFGIRERLYWVVCRKKLRA